MAELSKKPWALSPGVSRILSCHPSTLKEGLARQWRYWDNLRPPSSTSRSSADHLPAISPAPPPPGRHWGWSFEPTDLGACTSTISTHFPINQFQVYFGRNISWSVLSLLNHSSVFSVRSGCSGPSPLLLSRGLI